MSIFRTIRYFFPLHLLVMHFKRNLFALIFWLILFGFLTDSLGYAFGIPFLFYSPEYLGSVSSWSFIFVGFAVGGFIMSFNTYSYIRLGPEYPFLVLLNRPFFKFCLNNSVIPVIFVITYLYHVIDFQVQEEFSSTLQVIWYCLAFICGIFIFTFLSVLYFFPLNKKIMKITEESEGNMQSMLVRNPGTGSGNNKIYNYVSLGFKIKQSRPTDHIQNEILQKVANRNKINSSLFEILTITSFFIIGFFSAYKFFEIPAAASIILLLTVILMLFSALRAWLRGWVYFALIFVIGGINLLSKQTDYFQFTSYAFGLDYNPNAKEEYSIKRIQDHVADTTHQRLTFEDHIQTLENWKKNTKEEKPLMIIINCSGGGSRSALWTFDVLTKLENKLGNDFFDNITMITGASGGMVGASYTRELFLRKHLKEINLVGTNQQREAISHDLLNKLSFMASTNDIFVRYQHFDYNNHSYRIDRGYAFEQHLLENTDNILDHNLGYYKQYERSGLIPTMIFSPTIVNDGRRMLICSQDISFLAHPNFIDGLNNTSMENVEFNTFFSKQKADQIRFTSVLRANATFPFVMPMVTMPTSPSIQLMDAGIRDNYGTKTTIEYLRTLQDWIKENTSGVLIIQIRDTKNVLNDERYTEVSFTDKLLLPFNNIYKNFPRVQDYNQEELLRTFNSTCEFPIDVVSFNLRQSKNDRISLSWHLTTAEKKKINSTFDDTGNKSATERVIELLRKQKNGTQN